MAVGVADDGGRLVCDLEDRKIQIGLVEFGRTGVEGRRDLQSISCSSSNKAGVLQDVCGSQQKSTKDAEEGEPSVNGL